MSRAGPFGFLVRPAMWLALAACLSAGGPGWAQSPGEGSEQQVKAAFIYKFAGYVEWPEGALGAVDSPFAIGVVGSDALAAELAQVVDNRTVGERGVAVRRLKAGDPLADVRVLFISGADGFPAGQLRQWVQQRPVLVVAESETGLEQGAMINFVVADQRVRFEIALDAAEKNGLRLSSRLLAVAQKVITSGAP